MASQFSNMLSRSMWRYLPPLWSLVDVSVAISQRYEHLPSNLAGWRLGEISQWDVSLDIEAGPMLIDVNKSPGVENNLWYALPLKSFGTTTLAIHINLSSYQYGQSYCGDKVVVGSSYLHNGISYTGKTTSLIFIELASYSHPHPHPHLAAPSNYLKQCIMSLYGVHPWDISQLNHCSV